MRLLLAALSTLILVSCGPDKPEPPPYGRPSADDILRASKDEEAAAAKAKAKAQAAALAKAKAAGEELPPAPTPKQIAARKKSAKKDLVGSVTFALCGWAKTKRETLIGPGKAYQPQPLMGYYCDIQIVTEARSRKKRRVFMFKAENKWRLIQVDKKFISKLENFAEVDPAELAAFKAAEEAKSKKGKKKKKKPATT